jgi:hypothetical protein
MLIVPATRRNRASSFSLSQAHVERKQKQKQDSPAPGITAPGKERSKKKRAQITGPLLPPVSLFTSQPHTMASLETKKKLIIDTDPGIGRVPSVFSPSSFLSVCA